MLDRSRQVGDAGHIRLSASIDTHASVQPQAANLPRLKALNIPLRDRRGGKAVRPRNQRHPHPQHWRDRSAGLLCEISLSFLEYSFPCEEPALKRVCSFQLGR